MKIAKVRIRNFRTISDLDVELGDCTAMCGPNSSGKSNILAAIVFAFQPEITKEDIFQNLPRSKRSIHGGPKLSIYIDIDLVDVTPEVAKLAGVKTGAGVTYKFRAIRSGTITRSLGSHSLASLDALLTCVKIIYVPPIRDLTVGGLEPFRELFADALRKARGGKSMNAVLSSAKRVLEERAMRVLDPQTNVAENLLGAIRLQISTDQVSVDDLYRAVELTVRDQAGQKPLAELGTGHQSAVIVHLYRQLAEQSRTAVVLLLEEPDNHLHPSTIRSVAEDILQLAVNYQVVATTHSPIFLEAVGLRNVVPVTTTEEGHTTTRVVDLSHYEAKDIRRLLQQFNLRMTEPLLAKKVIVVEGAFDSAIITPLIEASIGGRAGDEGILILVAGGKEGVVTLCDFINSCGIDWAAVVDSDAAYSAEVPRTKVAITGAEKAAALAGATALSVILDTAKKRGKHAHKTISGIAEELVKGRPVPTAYTGSPLERLAEIASISLSDEAAVKQYLAGGHITKAAALLRDYGIILWTNDLEEVLVRNAQCEAVVEQQLVKQGVIKGPIGPGKRDQLIGLLRGAANEPDILANVVNELDAKKLFNRTEINKARAILTA